MAEILLYVAIGVAAVVGWVGHVVWFSLYRRRFMFSDTKRFTVVTKDSLTLMFSELWDRIPDLDELPKPVKDEDIVGTIEISTRFKEGDK